MRDVRLPEMSEWPFRDTVDVTFEGCCFPELLVLGSMFTPKTFARCTFRRTSMDGLHIRRAVFRECHFEDISLSSRHAGYIRQSRLEQCSLTGVSATEFILSDNTMIACDLQDIRAKRILQWKECTLRNVTVSGTVKNANIMRNRYTNVDFSAAQFSACGVLLPCDGVTLPDRPDNFVASVPALRASVDLVRGKIPDNMLQEYRSYVDSWKSTTPEFIDEGTLLIWLKDDAAVRTILATLYPIRAM